MHKREITNRSGNSSHCQIADVYFIALPGQQRKPYSVTVTQHLDDAEAIDWSTHTFKTDKLEVVQQVYAQHGDGLSKAQLAALGTQN